MANKISSSAHKTRIIPAFTIRAGNPKKPELSLGEVLNFIETATLQQSRVILNAMRHQQWYALNQVAYAFNGFAASPLRGDKGGLL